MEMIQEVGNKNLNYFGQALTYDIKSSVADVRSKADIEADEQIVNFLKEIFPEYSIYSEEQGEFNNNSEYRFIVDPLDGTNNFSIGVPVFTSSVALVKEDQIIFGVIYNPVTKNMYHAIKDQGAYKNHSKIKVNNNSEITSSTIAYTVGYSYPRMESLDRISKFTNLNCKRLTTFWSPANDYCLLASGRIEAIVNEKNDIYDYAAGKLIAMEAGAKITNLNGLPDTTASNSSFVASNATNIHDDILNVI